MSAHPQAVGPEPEQEDKNKTAINDSNKFFMIYIY
tara:strand:- start:285 stop:389 length:105 start_codon:yes stop_codon:yes gene_type:complete